MFTGLIQALGTIQPLGKDRFTLCVSNNSRQIMQDLALGDSVAVDGVCLTVEEILREGFVATASAETLQRTNLGQPSQGASFVNLETSLRVGGKIGGHFVTGHVDSVGCLKAVSAVDTAWEMTFGMVESFSEQWQQQIAPFLVAKGSIAVNGISLTIADCDAQGTWFRAAVIPHTYSYTNLSHLKIGTWVNLESDILGKYVNRFLAHHTKVSSQKEDISLDFLAEHGYLPL